MRKIKEIFVHWTACAFGDAKFIDRCHEERGFAAEYGGKVYHIGYHKLVLNGRLTKTGAYQPNLDGAVQDGRPEELTGAHVAGRNAHSLGVSYIGEPGSPVTARQYAALLDVVTDWCHKYGLTASDVRGHCEVDSGKPLCPSLDMNKFRAKVTAAL